MSGRVRLLIVVAVLVILIGVGAAVLLPTLNRQTGQNTNTTPAGTGTREVVQPTSAPGTPQVIVQPTIPTLEIVVAVQPIARGQVINPDMVAFRTWPEEYAPQNSIFSFEDVVGKIARTDIVREQPILNGLVVDNLNELGAVGSDAAAVLPPNTRLISIPIDGLTTGGYAIQPGDRVDAIISLLFVDLDDDFQTILPNGVRLFSLESIDPLTGTAKFTILADIEGREETVVVGGLTFPAFITPSEAPRPRLTTQMTIQDALVVYLGAFPEDGRLFADGAPTPIALPETQAQASPTPSNQRTSGTPVPTAAPVRPDIINLAVSPQDAVVIAYYVEAKIPVTFALRPAGEIGTQSTQPVTLDYIMRRYSIQLPTKLPYGVEPAIRSIRQLINTEQLVFEPNPDSNVQSSDGTGQ